MGLYITDYSFFLLFFKQISRIEVANKEARYIIKIKRFLITPGESNFTVRYISIFFLPLMLCFLEGKRLGSVSYL